MQPQFHLTDAGQPAARAIIQRGLAAFHDKHAGASGFRPLAILLLDGAGAAIGGLWGRTAWGWLFIELLFVPEAMRGGGVGRELVRRAEGEAVSRGCVGVWLDTFSFQARGFYEKLDYAVFGQLDDCPPGHSRLFMRKALSTRAEHGARERERA